MKDLLPPRPRVHVDRYPACSDEWRKETTRRDKFIVAQECINRLEDFNQSELKHFTQRVSAYDKALNLIVARYDRPPNAAGNRALLKSIVRNEQICFRSIDDNNEYGACFADYYRLLGRYRIDFRLLSEKRKMWKYI